MTEKKETYSFNGFVLDAAQRELRLRDRAVDIEPRAFDLLLFLVENRERAVGKDELQDAVWPGMIVTETALTRAVMKARKALGDNASRQIAIKTVHGHGYRFIAEVGLSGVSTDSDQSGQGSPTHQVTQKRKPARSIGRVAAMLGIAMVICGLAWYQWQPVNEPDGGQKVAVLPLTNNTGNPELAWADLGLMSYVAGLVSEGGNLEVVPNGNVISLVENLGWSGSLDDPESQQLLQKLAEVYGATHFLSMELLEDNRALRMNYRLLGPDNQAQQRGTMVGDEGTRLAEGVVQVVYGSLLGKTHDRPETLLVSADPFNNEAFARGMALSLQGRCAEAKQFFRVIIEQEPELFAPRFELASCLRILGEQEEAEPLLLSLVEEQEQLGNSASLSRSLMTLGVLYNRTGRVEEAIPVYRRALSVAQEVEDRLLEARVLQNLSIALKDTGELDQAEQLLDLAVLAYRDAGREILPGHLWSGRANIKMARGDFTGAATDLEEALAAFQEVGDLRNEAMMLNNTGYLLRRQGNFETAEGYHLRSLEIRESIGDRVGVGRSWGMLGVVYTARGQYEDAAEAARQSLAVAIETNDMLFQGTSLAQLADAEKAMGDTEAARTHYLEGRQILFDIGDHMRALQCDLKVAQLDLRAGQLMVAEETALQVLTVARDREFMAPEVQSQELLGDIHMARSQPAEAVKEYQRALTRAAETTWGGKINTLRYKLANAYMDQQALELAAPLIGALSGDTPNVQSLKAQARYHFLEGDSRMAVNLMQDAKNLAGEHWSDESETALQSYLLK